MQREDIGPVTAVPPGQVRPRRGALSVLDTDSLQDKVDAARADLELGEVKHAARALTEVLDEVERLRAVLSSEKSAPAEQPELSIVEASARGLNAELYSQPDPLLGSAWKALGRALDVLRLATEAGRGNARAWADYGTALDLVGRQDAAQAALTTAIERGDPAPATHRRLARILLAQGRAADAEALLRKALLADQGRDVETTRQLLASCLRTQHRDAEAAQAYLGVARAAVTAGKPDKALHAADQAVELAPDSAEAHLVRGDALRLLGRAGDAVAALDEALRVTPRDPRALAAKADVLRVAGDLPGALATVDLLVADLPHHPFALGLKGDVLRLMGRYAEALDLLDEAVALAPEDPWNVGTKGQVLRALGRLDEAREALTAALSQDDTYAWAWADLAATELSAGSPDDALVAAQKAMSLDAGNPLALAVVGRVHADRALGTDPSESALVAERSRHESAEAAEHALLELARIAPEGWVWRTLGQVRVVLGNGRGALEAAREAVAQYPDEASDELLTDLLLASGQHGQVRELLAGAVQAEDPPAWALRAYGTALRLGGEPEQALSHLERAVALAPEDPAGHGELARVLARLHRVDDALRSYAVALSLEGAAPELLTEAAALTGDSRGQPAVLAFLHELLDAQPDNLVIRRRTVEAEFELGRYEELLRTMEEGPRGGWTPEDLCTRGEALRLLGRAREARIAFKQALDLDDDYVPALTGLIYVFLDLDKPDRARNYAEKALRGREDNASLLADVALVDLAEGDPDAGLRRIRTALDLEPDNAWARSIAGRILNETGEWRDAVDALAPLESSGASAITLNEIAWARENAALAHVAGAAAPSGVARLDRTARSLLEGAHAAYRGAWQIDQQNVWYRRGVADTAALLGHEAAGHYDEIARQLEDTRSVDTDTMAVLAWCHYATRRYDAAIRLYINTIASAPPGAGYLHFDLGLAMLAGGQEELAGQEYRRGADAVAEGVGPAVHRWTAVAIARNDLTAARLLGVVPETAVPRLLAILDEAAAIRASRPQSGGRA